MSLTAEVCSRWQPIDKAIREILAGAAYADGNPKTFGEMETDAIELAAVMVTAMRNTSVTRCDEARDDRISNDVHHQQPSHQHTAISFDGLSLLRGHRQHDFHARSRASDSCGVSISIRSLIRATKSLGHRA
jgi:hypothetical protein